MPGRSREGNRIRATHPATTAGPGSGMNTNWANRSDMGVEKTAPGLRGGESEEQRTPANIC